jgi:MYXO-CTERM domain-containing protein
MRPRHLVTAACLLATAPALAAPGGTCAEAIDVAVLPFAHTSTTCGAANDFSNDTGAAAVCPDLPRPYAGEDTFYNVTLGPGNRLAFELTMPPGATGDLALFLVRQPTCADPQLCAASSVDLIGAGAGPERIKEQSFTPGTYRLIVDSALAPPSPAQCGGYTLAVTGHLSEFCGNGIVEAGEVCDDGNSVGGDCCAADCTSKAAAGTSCRPTAGPCDVAEVCDAGGNCPADQFAAATVCRPAAGICDAPELCTGTGPLCPADLVLPPSMVCRAATGTCDQAEFCTGGSPSCPADQFRPATVECVPGTMCQRAAHCAGNSGACLPGPAVNCDDFDSCTQDLCNLVVGCLHQRICAADAGVDASRDTAADLSPGDVAADVQADAPPVADALPPADGARDAAADAPGSPDGRADALAPTDARTLDAGPPGVAPSTDAGATGDAPSEQRPSTPAGMMDDAGVMVLADGGGLSDAAATRDGALSDGSLIRNNIAGDGCSCRLGSSSSGQEYGGWWVVPLMLSALIVRRRRITR